MSPRTKTDLAAATRKVALAKDCVDEAEQHCAGVQARLDAAQELLRVRRVELVQAGVAHTQAKAAAWIEDHQDVLDIVRAGTDSVRLAQLRLGKKAAPSYWDTEKFNWNDLGREVRQQLSEKT